jgi:hypothetical protein
MKHDVVLSPDQFDLIAEGRQNFIVVEDETIQRGDTLRLHRGIYKRTTGAYIDCAAAHVVTRHTCDGLLNGWSITAIKSKEP